MPVRQVSNRGRNTIGKYPSLKLNRMVAYESVLELDVIHLLEFSQSVTSYEEQPFTITYMDEVGKSRQYTPDFYVLSGELQAVIEVKPDKFVRKPDSQRRFRAASVWCSERGIGFQVITDKMLHLTRRTANIKFLAQFARYTIPGELQRSIADYLAAAPCPVPIGIAIVHLMPQNPQKALIPILHMAYFHRIRIDLNNVPISTQTHIWLAK